MTQYMLSVHGIDGEPLPPEEEMQQVFADVDAFNEEIQASGAWVFAGGLLPARHRDRRRGQGRRDVVTTDGPFAETKEHLGGFWVIEAPRPRRRARAGPRRRTGGLPGAGRGAAVPGRRAGRTGPIGRPTSDADDGRAGSSGEESGRCGGHPGPRLRRHRPRRGGGPGGVRRRRRALAGDGPAAQPRRLDHHDRPQPGHRPAPPRGRPATTRHAQAARLHRSRRTTTRRNGGGAACTTTGCGSIFTCCHPALAPTAQVRADAAAARRPADARDRAGLPGAGADDGPAHRAGEAQDPRRQHPVPGARRRGAARPAARRCCGRST